MKKIKMHIRPNETNRDFVVFNVIYSINRDKIHETGKPWEFSLEELKEKLEEENIHYEVKDIEKSLNNLYASEFITRKFNDGLKYRLIF